MSAYTKAVLFDLDGTLIDSAPDLAGAGNDIFHEGAAANGTKAANAYFYWFQTRSCFQG